MNSWDVTPFNWPDRYPWIVTNGDLVYGIGEAIIAFETREDARAKAVELNALEQAAGIRHVQGGAR